MKFAAGLIIFLLNSFVLEAQRTCVTADYINDHPAEVQRGGQEASGTSGRDTVPNEVINIPVVVHILYKTAAYNITDDQVQSQIDALNRDFRMLNTDAVNVPAAFKSRAADCRINFCLAKVAPGGYSTSGIVRKYTNKDFFYANDDMKFSSKAGSNAWDTKKYLNIWVCNLGSRALGYATPPGTDAAIDGLVISPTAFGTRGIVASPFNKGRTATHEVAHWLGLKHIWGDANCGSDEVDDTPPQYYRNFYCPTFPRISLCSVDANGDMFMNFMDLTNDDCMYMFTQGQKKKMRAQFASGNSRNSLLSSFVCDASLATGGPLPEDTIPVQGEKPADHIKLTSNPVSSFIEISSTEFSTLENKTAALYTAAGVLVQKNILIKANRHQIPVSKLPAGFYILKVGNGKEQTSFKVVKL